MTNHEKLKLMSVEELAAVLNSFVPYTDDMTSDVCWDCKRRHGGKCPIPDDEIGCLYASKNKFDDIINWLNIEATI